MNASVIEVDPFVKRYESVHAAEDLPFSVERGTTCALLGANGAGKDDHGSIRVLAAPSSSGLAAHESYVALR